MYNNFDLNKKAYSAQFGNVTGTFGMNTVPGNINTQMQAQLDPQAINQAAAKLNETATDSYLGQRLTSYSDIDPMLQYGVAVPTWVALNLTMDKVNKLYRGEYGKSLVGKCGNFGDKVSNLLFNNPIGRILNKTANIGKFIYKKAIYNNSAILRALDTTPSVQELTLAKAQAGGVKYQISHDAIGSIWEKFVEPSNCAKDLDSLGASKTQIAQIERNLEKFKSEEYKRAYLESEEFKLLNKNATQQQITAFKNSNAAQRKAILKELKVKILGFNDIAEFEKIKLSPEKYLDRILEIAKDRDPKIFSRIDFSDKNILTKAKGILGGRIVHDSETYNKLYGAMGGNHKTLLGKTLAKLSNNIVEGATNRLAGGKFAAIIHAFFLAEVLIRANRQEGMSNKFKSFMERYAELIGFFVFLPPSLRLMNKIGGLQYSGMTPQQVEAYRKAVLEFNEHVMNCDWTKTIYKQKRKELRAQFRPKTKNPLVWLARKTGDVVTVGLEQVRPWTKHKVEKVDLTITNVMKAPKQYLKNIPKRLADVARNPKYWLKQMAGYPVRFALPLVVFVPFFNKYLVKGVNAIFGKPSVGALADESKVEAEKEAAEKVNQTKQLNLPQDSVKNQQISYTGKLLTDNNHNIDNKDVTSVNTDADYIKRYIPSSKPVKLEEKATNDDEIDKLIKRADKAEKRVNDILSNKF